jgi:hypothetical protein
MYTKIKSYIKEYFFFQDLNAEIDGIFTALNDLDSLKQAVADCVSANTANKVVKRDANGDFAAHDITINKMIYADTAEVANLKAETATLADTATTMDGVRVRAYVSGANLTQTADTDIAFNAETTDVKNKYDTTTYRCTPGAGTYLVSATIKTDVVGMIIYIYVNGSLIARGMSTGTVSTVTDIVVLSSDTDYISFRCPITDKIYSGTDKSYFSITRIA